ncbi:phosphatase PAP2 family protein [Cetobacterium sp.]|uniref:phosphatase PAP2 family protein n=1 Tax=Cetobacterium sp. TaxID=2071632 RepID=UPI003EE6CF2C
MKLLGTVLLIFLISYIFIKRRDLLTVKFEFKINYLKYLILYLILILILVLFIDKKVAFFISNKYPTGYFSLHPDLNIEYTKIFKMITHLGEPEYVALLVFPMFLYSKIKSIVKLENASLGIIIVMILGVSISTILKIIFMRSRPFLEWNSSGFYFIEDILEREIPFKGSYMSFPSGHTMVAFCSYSFLAFKSQKTSIKVLCFLVAILVGISRICLSAHWMSDVFTSAVIGTVLGGIYANKR